MNAARSWMLAASLGSFAAGTSVGLLFTRLADRGSTPASEQEEEEYVSKLVADYGLNASQARSLRLIMQNQREQKIEYLLSAEPSQLPPATQNRLRSLGYQTTQRIRVLLDPQQRARYDLESRPGPNAGPEHGGPTTATNK